MFSATVQQIDCSSTVPICPERPRAVDGADGELKRYSNTCPFFLQARRLRTAAGQSESSRIVRRLVFCLRRRREPQHVRRN